ncbi:hypothetical protein SESBI_01448 [Sesbania bispinosa]|nr:hypothetical protein SESBI_01448 [Sesbania bispinosa]
MGWEVDKVQMTTQLKSSTRLTICAKVIKRLHREISTSELRGRKMTLDGRMEDFMRTVQIPENSKDERIFHGIRRGSGTILEAATVKKHFSYVPPAEAEERNDRNVKRSSSDEVDWILKPKTIPPGSGTRRLLGDFRHHIIKIPHHIN